MQYDDMKYMMDAYIG